MSDDVLHILEKLQQSTSGREIAAHLLRVPDAIVLSHGVQMQAECARHQFAAGASFLELRGASLHSVRDAHGLLPDWLNYEVEIWRFVLSRYAAGKGTEQLPDFMRGADGQSTSP